MEKASHLIISMETQRPQEHSLPDYISMYEIPGYPPITEKTFSKYVKSKKSDTTIRELSEYSPYIYRRKIECAPEDARADLRKKVSELIRAGFSSEHAEVQEICAEVIRSAPEHARKNLFQLAKKKIGAVLVEPALYRYREITQDAFQRAAFQKTGSETILLGGGLKNKTIVRRLQPDAFLTWQKLYENYAVWKQAGFDYIPIEPILRYNFNKERLVDVYSGVLDLSLHDWAQITNDFLNELYRDKDKIVAILDQQNISHGHTHDSNFCLRFFRDKHGNVDFSKKPRLYLIDFNQAVSP